MDARQQQFSALVSAYAADLYRYAAWLVRDRMLAEDLVQETFLRAWKAIDDLRDPKAAKSWLITILRRERARLYEKRRPDDEVVEDYDLDTLAGHDAGHERTEHFVLRRALLRLSQEYREPLLLQIVGGFSCEEIAALLGVEPGAVMTRLFRARRKLRRILEDSEPTDNDRTVTHGLP